MSALPGNTVLFVLMAVIWGLTWLPVKVAGLYVPPVMFAAVRFLIAAPLMLSVAACQGPVSPRGYGSRIIVSGLLINTGCYAFLFWGVVHAPSGLAAIVNLSMIPVFTVLFGWLYGEEVLDRRKLTAIAAGILGLSLLYSSRVQGGVADPAQALGLGAIVVATASYCWGAILSRPLVRVFPPLVLAGWQSLVGAISLTVLALLIEPVDKAALGALLHWPVNAALAFMIIGGTFLAFTIYLRLVRDWGAFRAGLYAFISPVIAVLVGIITLGEPFGIREALGAVVMFAAAALAIRRPAALQAR